MSAIPLYWYCETDVEGEAFEIPPGGILRPEPFTGVVALVTPDGEVYGEAVLMCALPWPCFRGLHDGEQVVLPYRTAVALEQFEVAVSAAGMPREFACGCDEALDRRAHYRVQIRDGTVYAGLVCGRLHCIVELQLGECKGVPPFALSPCNRLKAGRQKPSYASVTRPESMT